MSTPERLRAQLEKDLGRVDIYLSEILTPADIRKGSLFFFFESFVLDFQFDLLLELLLLLKKVEKN